MIILNLKGGLGNQMFQYATGKSLSLKNNTELFLDKSGLEATSKDTQRNYDLGKFNITENFPTPEEIRKIKYPLGIISKIKRGINSKVFKKHYLEFAPKLKDTSYLDGFFQSEENFRDIRDILIKEFILKPQHISKTTKEHLDEILNSNSVSIHIRRGDYVSNKEANKYHGICSIEYYQKAIDLILEKVDNPTFYIFSDNIDWVKDNLEIKQPHTFIENLTHHEDMYLMSKCKHNIIANSSFSWWSAWLNENNDKIVISPTPWVDKKPNPHKNITPESWIKIQK